VGTDGKGLSGLEYKLDGELHGADGERRIVRDGVGDDVAVRDLTPARPGTRVELTLDSNIQDKTEDVLKGIGQTFRPKGATAVVMDPRSGEILALANWPQIDANRPSDAPGYANQNRAVGYTFEPGSTFKAFTVAGAIEDGLVQADTSFNLPPQITLYDRTIGNSHPRGWATMTTAQILAQSDNVGAITIGQRLGAKRFDTWVRRFGFGKPTGIALPGEERGIVLPLDRYSGSSMGNLPIGQGESVTSIQIAQAYAAIANGGIMRRPEIVRRIDGQAARAPAGRRILSEATSASLRGMLKGVLAAGGTASEVHIPGYELAGKTGTANKVDAATGEYSKSRYVASFVGFAPADHPKLLISIMVDEPQGGIYGGQVAAPAFGKIASFALPYLDIPPG
jgi:cell division protein FtsI/penicillin-binding protein 2